MGLLKNLTSAFQKGLFAFFRSPAPVEEDQTGTGTSEMYFKGAWVEEGEAKWAFFKQDEEQDQAELKMVDSVSPVETETVKRKSDEKMSEPEVVPEESATDTISITDLGRKQTSRYGRPEPVVEETFQKEKQKEEEAQTEEVSDGLIDQRELFGTEADIQVFFAEDNKNIQLMLRTLIKNAKGMELQDWAFDGEDAVEKIRCMSEFPDVILMDIDMPRLNGIDTTREILRINPVQKIVMLTALGDKENVISAFEAGAIGYLRKDADISLILGAIKQAARGGRPVHKGVAGYLKDEKVQDKLKRKKDLVDTEPEKKSSEEKKKKSSEEKKKKSSEEKKKKSSEEKKKKSSEEKKKKSSEEKKKKSSKSCFVAPIPSRMGMAISIRTT